MNMMISDQAITYNPRNLQRIPKMRKKDQEMIHKRMTAKTWVTVIFQILEGRKAAEWT